MARCGASFRSTDSHGTSRLGSGDIPAHWRIAVMHPIIREDIRLIRELLEDDDDGEEEEASEDHP